MSERIPSSSPGPLPLERGRRSRVVVVATVAACASLLLAVGLFLRAPSDVASVSRSDRRPAASSGPVAVPVRDSVHRGRAVPSGVASVRFRFEDGRALPPALRADLGEGPQVHALDARGIARLDAPIDPDAFGCDVVEVERRLHRASVRLLTPAEEADALVELAPAALTSISIRSAHTGDPLRGGIILNVPGDADFAQLVGEAPSVERYPELPYERLGERLVVADEHLGKSCIAYADGHTPIEFVIPRTAGVSTVLELRELAYVTVLLPPRRDGIRHGLYFRDIGRTVPLTDEADELGVVERVPACPGPRLIVGLERQVDGDLYREITSEAHRLVSGEEVVIDLAAALVRPPYASVSGEIDLAALEGPVEDIGKVVLLREPDGAVDALLEPKVIGTVRVGSSFLWEAPSPVPAGRYTVVSPFLGAISRFDLAAGSEQHVRWELRPEWSVEVGVVDAVSGARIRSASVWTFSTLAGPVEVLSAHGFWGRARSPDGTCTLHADSALVRAEAAGYVPATRAIERSQQLDAVEIALVPCPRIEVELRSGPDVPPFELAELRGLALKWRRAATSAWDQSPLRPKRGLGEGDWLLSATLPSAGSYELRLPSALQGADLRDSQRVELVGGQVVHWPAGQVPDGDGAR